MHAKLGVSLWQKNDTKHKEEVEYNFISFIPLRFNINIEGI